MEHYQIRNEEWLERYLDLMPCDQCGAEAVDSYRMTFVPNIDEEDRPSPHQMAQQDVSIKMLAREASRQYVFCPKCIDLYDSLKRRRTELIEEAKELRRERSEREARAIAEVDARLKGEGISTHVADRLLDREPEDLLR